MDNLKSLVAQNKMRDQFEAWVMSKYIISKSTLEGMRIPTGYRNSTLSGRDYNGLWESWRDSRKAIEIAITPQPEKVVWGYAGCGPDDYYETIAFARSHDEKSVDGTEPMSIYLDWQIANALEEAGIVFKGK